MATAYGIVLTENGFAQRLEVSSVFKPGDGLLIAECNVTQSIRVVLYAVMEAIASLESYIDGLSCEKFGTHDLIVTMQAQNLGETPIDGESYGLPLAMSIVAAMLRTEIFEFRTTCFTGVIAPGGSVLPVEGINRKRDLAPMLGFSKLVLPSQQLDLFNTKINQCPVDSIYGAVGGHFWET